MTAMPCARRNNTVVQELEGEVLIYDLSVNKAFCLNQTSGLVFQLADGTRSVAEISALMTKQLQAFVSDDLVWLALDELKKERLLENGGEINNQLAGLSRREAVKRVGFASAVLLPVIASVVAPSAVMAQSGGLLALNSPCSMNNQCLTNFCAPGNKCCVAGTAFAGAPGSGVCSGLGTCAPEAMNCCSGIIINQGMAPCGGAGDYCVCG